MTEIFAWIAYLAVGWLLAFFVLHYEEDRTVGLFLAAILLWPFVLVVVLSKLVLGARF